MQENHEFEFQFYTILESPISRTYTCGNKFDRGNAILPFPEYKSQKRTREITKFRKMIFFEEIKII